MACFRFKIYRPNKGENMTVPFMSYLNRTGLELEEAQEVDMLTSTAQTAHSWISLQATIRASGMKKLAKAEAAAVRLTVRLLASRNAFTNPFTASIYM